MSNIDKGFEKWLKEQDKIERTYTADLFDAFIAGATWQREQLIQELREWIRGHYWDTWQEHRHLIVQHIEAKLDLLAKGR